MNLKELREMIDLMQQNGLTELEIERNGFKIRLKKSSGGIDVRREKEGEVRILSVPEQELRSSQGEKQAKESEGIEVVHSPMVGTFYAAPNPDQEPYVTKGKDVKEGDVLCIVEAMKLMNEIKSEVSGKVVDILVANGQPVEFDQPLFKIQKI